MHILQLTTSGEVGGSHIHMRILIDKLVGDGHKVTVAFGPGETFKELLSQSKVSIVNIPNLVRKISLINDIKALLQIIKLLKKERPDLVAIHSTKSGVLGRIAAKIVGVPAVFTAHSWIFSNKDNVLTRILGTISENIVSLFSANVISVSKYDYDIGESFVKIGHKLHECIYNGIQELSLTPMAKNFDFIMVARFAEPKNHEDLIHAFSKTKNKSNLMLVGNGPKLESIKNLVHDLNLNHRVNFAGYTTEVDKFLSQSRVFILWSKSEGFPISTLEAMRAGLPLIVSDVGGCREAVEIDNCGFCIEPSDTKTLTEILDKLYTDKTLCKNLGEQARLSFEKNFTDEKMYTQTIKFYEKVVLMQR